MGHILHDWSLSEKQALVAKAHGALPDGGALIAFDAIIDDERRRNAFGLRDDKRSGTGRDRLRRYAWSVETRCFVRLRDACAR